MSATKNVVFHEVGHMVVGLCIGIVEDCIDFYPAAGEVARARYSSLGVSPVQIIKRSLGGLLCEVLLLPKTIEPRLLNAYKHSIIIVEGHPFFNDLNAEERDFLSGARDDMRGARMLAMESSEQNCSGAIDSLREAETEVRKIILQQRAGICRVVRDIREWERSLNKGDLPIYGAAQARKFLLG